MSRWSWYKRKIKAIIRLIKSDNWILIANDHCDIMAEDRKVKKMGVILSNLEDIEAGERAVNSIKEILK